MLHILEYRALNALTNHKHAISFLRPRDECSLESIVPPLSPGKFTIFAIIVDNVQYPLVDTYPRRARFFKGLIEMGKKVTDIERFDYGEVLRSLDRKFGLHIRID